METNHCRTKAAQANLLSYCANDLNRDELRSLALSTKRKDFFPSFFFSLNFEKRKQSILAHRIIVLPIVVEIFVAVTTIVIPGVAGV